MNDLFNEIGGTKFVVYEEDYHYVTSFLQESGLCWCGGDDLSEFTPDCLFKDKCVYLFVEPEVYEESDLWNSREDGAKRVISYLTRDEYNDPDEDEGDYVFKYQEIDILEFINNYCDNSIEDIEISLQELLI